MTWLNVADLYNKLERHAPRLSFVGFLRDYCKHCHTARAKHVAGKCLFNASTFQSIGSLNAVKFVEATGLAHDMEAWHKHIYEEVPE